VSANLLPFGAWIYTGEFDSKMIRFVFNIKRIFLALLLPVGVYVIGKLITLYRDFQLQQQFLLIAWIKTLAILFSALLILVLLPEFALLVGKRNFFLFILQSTGGVAILTYVVYRHYIFSNMLRASTISEATLESNKYYEIILQLFDKEKIYRNQQLRIADIAKKLELSPNYVSTIINENASMGFNELVNQYRINEVIEKFRNNEHHIKSIAALAEEAGFGSKSTFQATFKKQIGKTPTEFLQTLPTKNNQNKNIP
jgi:AraC-like DNA-binding protein